MIHAGKIPFSVLKKFLLIALVTFSLPTVAANLEFTDAWIKHLPPVVPVRAGYMTITNTTNLDVTIVSLHSESFDSIEIHQSYEVDGIASMRAVAVLSIGSNESVTLEPGGYHLMMMGPADEIIPGKIAIVTLHYQDHDSQTIEMPVRK